MNANRLFSIYQYMQIAANRWIVVDIKGALHLSEMTRHQTGLYAHWMNSESEGLFFFFSEGKTKFIRLWNRHGKYRIEKEGSYSIFRAISICQNASPTNQLVRKRPTAACAHPFEGLVFYRKGKICLWLWNTKNTNYRMEIEESLLIIRAHFANGTHKFYGMLNERYLCLWNRNNNYWTQI